MTKQTRRRFSPEYKEQSVARLPDAGTGQERYDHRSGRIGEEPPGPDFGSNVSKVGQKTEQVTYQSGSTSTRS